MKLNPIKSNMTELELGNIKVLFSYKTPVACYHPGKIRTNPWFKTNKKWSRTTSKHINQWLNGQTAIEVPQESLDKFASSLDRSLFLYEIQPYQE